MNTQGGYLHSHAHAYPTGSKRKLTVSESRSRADWQNNKSPSTPIKTTTTIGESSMDPNRTHLPLTPGMTSLSRRSYKVPRSGWNMYRRKRGFTRTISDHLLVRLISRMKSLDTGSRGKLTFSFEPDLADGRFAGDANDDFIVEIQPKTRGRRDRQARHRLKTLRSEFRLRHALSGCYLFSHKVKLPEWGFEQQEVSFRDSTSATS